MNRHQSEQNSKRQQLSRCSRYTERKDVNWWAAKRRMIFSPKVHLPVPVVASQAIFPSKEVQDTEN